MSDKWECVEESLKILEEQLEIHNAAADVVGLSPESNLSEPLYKVETTSFLTN